MKGWLRSLEGRLLVRLSVVFLASIILMGLAVAYQAYWKALEVGNEALAHAFLQEFLTEVIWLVPLIAMLALGTATWTIRSGLSTVVHVSDAAKRISPSSMGMRLPTKNLPTEVVPLVSAVNDALGRLEQGYSAQRTFTARAAHELRTPLAILGAGLENLGRGPEVEALRADAKRMNRLVEQLLQVARLDALPLDVSATVDLQTVAAEVVEYLAPWAVVRGRSLSLDAPGQPVLILGNADALGDAIRNLVDNAVTHAPKGTEVTVKVGSNGTLSVSDQGPGVPAQNRTHVFERFWRSPDELKFGPGAGLGLAIVSEIIKAHRASIAIHDAEQGGACFLIDFGAQPSITKGPCRTTR